MTNNNYNKNIKTILQHFNENLSGDELKNAIENTEEEILNSKCDTFDGAIFSAFIWEKTKQGHEYWQNITNKFYEQN